MIPPTSRLKRLAATAGHGLVVAAALAATGGRLPAAEVTIALVAAAIAPTPPLDAPAEQRADR